MESPVHYRTLQDSTVEDISGQYRTLQDSTVQDSTVMERTRESRAGSGSGDMCQMTDYRGLIPLLLDLHYDLTDINNPPTV